MSDLEKVKMSDKQIIEIGGVKMEVDLRHATIIDHYKVGDNVKVLKKEYSDTYTSYPGVIVGFDNFIKLPTIVIAYLNGSYQNEVKFMYLNNKTDGVEICKMTGEHEVINKQSTLEILNRKIQEEEANITKLKMERDYFLTNFNKYFKETSR